MVFNHKGRNIGKYDKNKLVPFGEYIPFRKKIKFLKLLASDKEFSEGRKVDHFFKFGNLNLYPMICYEAIFPWKNNKRNSYDLIVNITNDSWFGNTFGPIKHFWLSKQRAIETGIPMIRVSNSGISAVIAPNGKEIGKINYGISGFLDMKKIHADKAPLNRNITAEEVAKTALFLCSDMSSGITGTIIPVDAGYHIMAI